MTNVKRTEYSLQSTEYSLRDVLDKFGLPISVTTSRRCLLSGGFVFEAGMDFTVLQRECVELLFGTDWNGSIFRLNTSRKADIYVDIVDEIYPADLTDLILLFPNITYILSKVSQDQEFFRLVDRNYTFADLNNIALISSKGETFYHALESLLDKRLFVFVHCKETVSLEVFLSRKLIKGTILRFITNLSQVPSGNVVIDGLHVYDSILTVSTLKNYSNKLLYEILQLDSNITVFISNELESVHLNELGEYGSNKYLIKVAEIKYSIHYEIYSPIFYGQLLIDFLLVNQIKNASHTVQKESNSEHALNLKTNNNLIKTKKNINKNNLHRPSLMHSPPAQNALEILKFQKNSSSLKSFFPTKKSSELQLFASDDVFKIPDIEDEILHGQIERNERSNRRKSSIVDISSKPLDSMKEIKERAYDANISNIYSEVYEKTNENSLYGSSKFYEALNLKDKHLSKRKLFCKTKSKSFEDKKTQSSFPVLQKITLNKKLSKSDTCISQSLSKEESLYTCLNISKSNNNLFSGYLNIFNKKRKKVKKKLSKSDTCLPESVENETNIYACINSSRSTNDLSSSYMKVAYEVVKPKKVGNKQQIKPIESLEDIFTCSIDDVAKRLDGLKLGKFAKKFKRQLINGRLLGNLSEEALREIGLTHFEARKLYKYVHGWRVKTTNYPNSLENSRVTDWSVNDVKYIMKTIRLNRLGVFAVENLVDGVLLEDLIKNNFIKTLDNDYGIRLTMVEFERLRSYVYKELIYQPHEIAVGSLAGKKMF